MFNLFNKNKKPETIAEVLQYLEKLETEINSLKTQIANLKKKGEFSVSKVEIMRYNPFSSSGGDQSFTIALLDQHNDGVIVTSLFSQEGNRVYAKAIKNGKSEYTLSNEENQILKKIV